VAPPTKYDLVQQPLLDPVKQLLWEQHAVFHKQNFPQKFAEQKSKRFKKDSRWSAQLEKWNGLNRFKTPAKSIFFER